MGEALLPAQSVAFVLLVWFLAYLGLIIRAYRRRPDDQTGDPLDFDWHVLIPCLDEAKVIAGTLTRLRTVLPGVHVWVIDDDSTDATASLVGALGEGDRKVHLVSRRPPEARQGKGPALNAGYQAVLAHLEATGVGPDEHDEVVVVVLDADGELAATALAALASPGAFGDPAVGAAQMRVVMGNVGRRTVVAPGRFWGLRQAAARWLVRNQDIEFQTTIAAMQTLRQTTGSVGLGGNGQATRLSVLTRIEAAFGGPWHGALLEDYELGVHSILVGARTAYVHDATVTQEALPRLRPYLTQRTRWTQGGMQCARYLPQVLRSRNFSNGAVLETCYFLLAPWIGVAGIVVWPIALASMVLYAEQSFGGLVPWLLQVWWIYPAFVLTGIAPFALWGLLYRRDCRPDASRRRALAWGFGYWLYMYLTHIVLVRALVRLVRGRRSWAKTARVGMGPAPRRRPVPAGGSTR